MHCSESSSGNHQEEIEPGKHSSQRKHFAQMSVNTLPTKDIKKQGKSTFSSLKICIKKRRKLSFLMKGLLYFFVNLKDVQIHCPCHRNLPFVRLSAQAQ
jgi:hypothetical protein